MITISGSAFDISSISGEYPENSVERQLLNKLSASSETYRYDSLNQLKFELDLRKEIVGAAIALNSSGLSFSVFHDSFCNPEYWDRAANGGFSLKEGVKPSEAISDIFENGGEYGTECATAMMIVYYKALLGVYGEELFNKLFPKIYLMDWDVTEPLLKEVGIPRKAADILLGDRGYFANPDVNPATPQWQGENVIVLPDSMYYGHGIGVRTAEEIIRALNANRKKNASQSAYLLDTVSRPDFKKLAGVTQSQSASTQAAPQVRALFRPQYQAVLDPGIWHIE